MLIITRNKLVKDAIDDKNQEIALLHKKLVRICCLMSLLLTAMIRSWLSPQTPRSPKSATDWCVTTSVLFVLEVFWQRSEISRQKTDAQSSIAAINAEHATFTAVCLTVHILVVSHEFRRWSKS